MRTILAVLMLLAASGSHATPAPGIAWQAWSPQGFEQAQRDKRVVFLYLEAVWCHWCHVMQQTTLSDPQVQRALAKHFVAIKVDHDANPLLANRFRDYGWPALIFFAADGTELVKRAGHIEPEPFLRLLQAIVDDPSPERETDPSRVVASGAVGLPDAARARLLRLHDKSYDTNLGGLLIAQKFIDRDSVEYSIVHRSQAREKDKALQTLDAAQALIDPVWGGAYQYSTGGVWTRPHFEKIMRVQAGYLRSYALAWAAFGRERDRRAARSLRDYLLNFLRAPDGGFYASQDADVVQGSKATDYFALGDRARRARGMPRIDRNQYAQETGQAAEALAVWHESAGDPEALAAAIGAARWALAQRALPGGGFRHGSDAGSALYLGDTLAMGRAFLQLYRVTADRQWLQHAVAAAQFIELNFRQANAGYRTAAQAVGPVQPLPTLEENIAVARYFNLLQAYSAAPGLKAQARHALSWLGAAAGRISVEEIGIVLAAEELQEDPTHLTVVGPRDDAVAARLFELALRAPGAYKRVEWLDRRDGPLRNNDVEYPAFGRTAAYVCTEQRCSTPAFTPEAYAQALQRLRKPG